MNATKKALLALLALGAALLLPATAATAAQAPAWSLGVQALPSNFEAGEEGSRRLGPEYLLVATNVGAEVAEGQVTLNLTLPPQLSAVASEAEGLAGGDPEAPIPTCSVAAQKVTCTTAGPVHPGRQVSVAVPVDVSGLASGSLLAQAAVSGGGAPTATATVSTPVDSSPLPFGFLPGAAGLSAPLSEEDGSPAIQAGSHPYQLTVGLGFPVARPGQSLTGSGHPRDIFTDLPRGTIVNPQATPERCTEAELIGADCPPASQVGIATVLTLPVSSPVSIPTPLYNMVAPPGTPALLGFEAARVGFFAHIAGSVRSDGDYGLSASSEDLIALSANPLMGVSVQLWGDPSAASHDSLRSEDCFLRGGSCPVPEGNTALLTMPSHCTGTEPITTRARADSWEEPGVFEEASYDSAGLEGTEVGVSGCGLQEFEPTISSKPTTSLADSPSGLDFNLHQPQDTELGHISPANLRDATVTLPEGIAANPAQAGGMQACSEAQIGYDPKTGHYSKAPDTCPDAAKIGTVEVRTPLLKEFDANGKPAGNRPIEGSVFIAKPFENEFDSLLAIYLSVNDPQSGTIAKLAGKVIPDPVTGQLRTRFTENPELPIEDVKLHLFGGARGALVTPPTCGKYTTTSELTPWSTPEGQDAHPSDSFQTTGAPNGGSCPTSAGAMANSPSFTAGTEAPQAGEYSPFVLKLSREDGSQRLSGFDTTLPPGLTGKLAGVSTCSDAQIAQATSHSNPEQGQVEQANPSCPSSSEVGVVRAGAGAGPTPFYATGHAYLSGPYKGAPLSMVVITPAVAGPFDLGVVVVRAALYLDPVTAQIHAVSDPFPTILHGIPLDLRSVSVELTRNRFTLNPTSCERFSIAGTSTSALGGAAALSNPFQVGGCRGIEFEPRMTLKLKGGTRRAAHPELIATVYSGGAGVANLSRVQVKLPPTAFLDQAHIRTVCTRVQFAAGAGNGAECPAGSIYGHASVKTPLFDYTIEGDVLLRSSNHKLPDLVIALDGPASQPIAVELSGRTDSVRGALRNTFESVPDQPFDRARVVLFGGKRGLVVNSRNLCAQKQRANVKLNAQSGEIAQLRPIVRNNCKKPKRGGRR